MLRHRPASLTVLAAALATVGLLATSTPVPSAAAPGRAVPFAAAPGRPVLSAANLPRAGDLEFHRAGDWRVRATSATVGVTPISDCFTGRDIEDLDVRNLQRRDYSLRQDSSQPATALSLEFASAKAAERAYSTLRSWITACPKTLRDLGYGRASVDPWLRVAAGDRGGFTVVSHSTFDQSDADSGVFEEVGLTRVGPRVGFVVMATTGQDYNWSSVPDPDLTSYPSIRSLPKVAERLARDLTAHRALRSDQLLRIRDVPRLGDEVIQRAEPGEGRSIDGASICTRDTGLAEFGAAQARSRTFTINGVSRVFSVALQYPNVRAAKSAARTLRERIAVCPKTLRESGFGITQRGVDWIKAPTGHGNGRFAELTYQRPAEIGSENATFESVGVTRVGDRLMITVYVVDGQDFNVSLRSDGDPESGIPAHPQFGLIRAAANRLSD